METLDAINSLQLANCVPLDGTATIAPIAKKSGLSAARRALPSSRDG